MRLCLVVSLSCALATCAGCRRSVTIDEGPPASPSSADAGTSATPDGGAPRDRAWTDIVTGLESPEALVADAAHLYWTDGSTGEILSIDRGSPGASPVVIARAQPLSFALKHDPLLVLQGEDLFFLTSTTVERRHDDGSLRRVSAKGGAVTVLASGLQAPAGLAVDATSVFFLVGARDEIRADGVMKTAKDGSLRRTSLRGGPQKVLASGLGGPCAIAIDDRFVYFLDGPLKKVPKDGGPVTTLSPPSALPECEIALDATHLYWRDGRQHEWVRTDKDTGASTPLKHAGVSSVLHGAVAAGDALYWVQAPVLTSGRDEIFFAPKSGGEARALGQGAPWRAMHQVLVKDGAAYVSIGTDRGTRTRGVIRRMALE